MEELKKMRPTTTFAVVLLLAAVAQAADEPAWVKEWERQWPTLHLSCPGDDGSHASGVVIVVDDYSIAENCLRAVLTVSNTGNETVIIPSRNSEIRFFGAEIINSNGEPISYCGGVRALEEKGFELDLPGRNDFLTLLPGEHATIDPGCLAPFWWYLRDEYHDAKSFEVSYSFYEPEFQVPLKRAREYRRTLATIRPAFCSLFRAEVKSPRIVIDWSRYTPDQP